MLRIFFSQKRINIFCPLVQLPLIIMIYYDARRYTASTHTHTHTDKITNFSNDNIWRCENQPIDQGVHCLFVHRAHITQHLHLFCRHQATSVEPSMPNCSQQNTKTKPSLPSKYNSFDSSQSNINVRHVYTHNGTVKSYYFNIKQALTRMPSKNSFVFSSTYRASVFKMHRKEIYGGPVKIYTTKLCTNKMFGTTNRR